MTGPEQTKYRGILQELANLQTVRHLFTDDLTTRHTTSTDLKVREAYLIELIKGYLTNEG